MFIAILPQPLLQLSAFPVLYPSHPLFFNLAQGWGDCGGGRRCGRGCVIRGRVLLSRTLCFIFIKSSRFDSLLLDVWRHRLSQRCRGNHALTTPPTLQPNPSSARTLFLDCPPTHTPPLHWLCRSSAQPSGCSPSY